MISSISECSGLISSFRVHWKSAGFFQTPLTMLVRSPSGWTFTPHGKKKPSRYWPQRPNVKKWEQVPQPLWENAKHELPEVSCQAQGQSQDMDNVADLFKRCLDIGKYLSLSLGLAVSL